jgi:hypothetical protein
MAKPHQTQGQWVDWCSALSTSLTMAKVVRVYALHGSRTTTVAVGMSARWWGGYQAFEPEIQWFPLTSTVVPFVSTSAVFEEHTDVQGYGWSVWAGAYMPVSLISDRLSWTAGVGWRSLYVEERSDNHWLRIRAGVLMHL